MTAQKLDGAALSKKLKAALMPRIESVKKKRGSAPSLMIVGRPDDGPQESYRQAQLKACADLGLGARWFSLASTDAASILKLINENPEFDGVILHLPFPGVDVDQLLGALPPERDAEGVTPANFGRLFQVKSYEAIGRDGLVAPCTALAIAELVKSSGMPLAGKTAVVLGRSNIVGKPAAHLLTCMDLTTTLCHSKTPGLSRLIGQADVVVAAIGKPRFVKADWIKPGALVIDAGINTAGGKLCGDIDPLAAEKAAYLTPVPGGVGPVTTAMLLANVVTLAERHL